MKHCPLCLRILVAAAGFVIAMLLLGTAAQGQYVPRFHRYAMTRLDDTTTLDMVKDASPNRPPTCWLVYRTNSPYNGDRNEGIAVTSLGPVPCDPIPVPPVKGDAPPASAVR